MGKTPDAQTISAHVRNDIVREIISRGAALNLKKGSYLALVLEWWAAQGFPAVTRADQAMQDLKALQAAEAKQSHYGGSHTKKKARLSAQLLRFPTGEPIQFP